MGCSGYGSCGPQLGSSSTLTLSNTNWDNGDGTPKRLSSSNKVTKADILELKKLSLELKNHTHGLPTAAPDFTFVDLNNISKKYKVQITELRSFMTLVKTHTHGSGDYAPSATTDDSWDIPLTGFVKISPGFANELRNSFESILSHYHTYVVCGSHSYCGCNGQCSHCGG